MKNEYQIIGVMSGTSLDGIDLALIQLKVFEKKWSYSIIKATTVPYTNDWVNQLKEGINMSFAELEQLDMDYTEFLGQAINSFINQNNITAIDAICSHGHTIVHQPEHGITVQIGNLPEIADITKQTVVCDFRVQDVELGGQGAPLVPIGDKILFSEFDYCLNLGGFSNISFEGKRKRLAFDISPVNTVMNFYANKLGQAYDAEGKLAQSGNLDKTLFNKLNNVNHYYKGYPKSLGFEFVQDTILPITENILISPQDILHTFVEHIAYQTLRALPVKKGKMLVTGGGAYNNYLIQRMQQYLPQMELIIPDGQTIEYKEALLFGLLGVLRLRNEDNVLASVTGASRNHCSGKIYSPTSSES